MARQESDQGCLNLKATELRLALPGSDEPVRPTTTSTCNSSSKKRSSRDAEDDDNIPPAKAQIVGWPPVQSYRKNMNLQPKKGNGSGLYVKVNMDGAPFMRKIDINARKGYGELLQVLEGMFKVKIGGYSEKQGYGQSNYTPSYQDKEGDWMLVGDVPWDMFVSSCKMLRIINSSEAKGLCI